jgi:salicylate hydroxylase
MSIGTSLIPGSLTASLLIYSVIAPSGHLITLHRADFQSVLLRHLALAPNVKTHCSKRILSFSQHDSRVYLQFEDGTMAECDVFVGSDGYKSIVRKGILTELANGAAADGKEDEAMKILESVDPRWAGMFAYRSLFPAEKLRKRFPGHRSLIPPNKCVIIFFLFSPMLYLMIRGSSLSAKARCVS